MHESNTRDADERKAADWGSDLLMHVLAGPLSVCSRNVSSLRPPQERPFAGPGCRPNYFKHVHRASSVNKTNLLASDLTAFLTTPPSLPSNGLKKKEILCYFNNTIRRLHDGLAIQFANVFY